MPGIQTSDRNRTLPLRLAGEGIGAAMAACGAGSDASLMIATLFITNLPQNREQPVWVVGGDGGLIGSAFCPVPPGRGRS